MTDTTCKARLHEFNGKVAINFKGQPTVYITWKLAEKLAKELKFAAAQSKNNNHYPTTEINT